MRISAKVSGVKETQMRLQEFQQELEEHMERIIREAAEVVREDAVQNAPVDTGALRDSIDKEIETSVKPYFARVFVGAEYAPYTEYGTIYIAEQRYFRNAVDKGFQYIEQEASKIFD